MEIRTSVTKYVTDRIAATRQAQSLLPANSVETKPGGYQNVSVIKANSMKHMPNFFAKGQVRPFLPLENGQGTCCICHLGWRGGIGGVKSFKTDVNLGPVARKDIFPLPRPSFQEPQAQGQNHHVCCLFRETLCKLGMSNNQKKKK